MKLWIARDNYNDVYGRGLIKEGLAIDATNLNIY